MNTATTEPIIQDWTERANRLQLAQSICEQLAQLEIGGIPAELIPLLADAANELASQVGGQSRVAVDDAPIVMIRVISRSAASDPAAGGQHSAALLSRLLA